ncbi:MAG: TAXI family TRAP transporter solute-binding subunit [Clostridia bacterium]|nr:TAXI family TRAP transporter solute-binding subunit [Clostridia bacterium]
MKRILAVLLAVALVFSFAACGKTSGGNEQAPVKLRFVTGGESGTYYAFGSVIAQHATNNTNVKVTGVVGNGSQKNIVELQDGNAELAFCQSDVMAYAYQGTNLFAETGKVDCFKTVAALYTEQVQLITTDPSIKSVADLKGKNVSIGAAGSGVYFNAIDILGVYGLTEKDIKPTYQSFGDSAEAIKDGLIDAAFIVAGAPTSAVTDLATTKNVYLVSLDDEHINKLIEKSPFYSKCVIPAETYKGVAEATTVGVGAVIIAKDTVSEDAIYAFVKDIFDNAESQIGAHAKYAELSLEFASSITSVPYHAGAAKYFAEKGITVPTV